MDPKKTTLFRLVWPVFKSTMGCERNWIKCRTIHITSFMCMYLSINIFYLFCILKFWIFRRIVINKTMSDGLPAWHKKDKGVVPKMCSSLCRIHCPTTERSQKLQEAPNYISKIASEVWYKPYIKCYITLFLFQHSYSTLSTPSGFIKNGTTRKFSERISSVPL